MVTAGLEFRFCRDLENAAGGAARCPVDRQRTSVRVGWRRGGVLLTLRWFIAVPQPAAGRIGQPQPAFSTGVSALLSSNSVLPGTRET